MPLFDTHCHIHEAVRRTTPVYDKWHEDGKDHDPDEMISSARAAGVQYMLCVGTTLADSELAIEFVQAKPDLWATIGIHPHEAGGHLDEAVQQQFKALATSPKVVAVGECGLDYFYSHSSREDQIRLLRLQIELALSHGLPLVFHVREAFDDFWPILESYQGVRGVLHSFTDSAANLDRALSHGLYIGVNGIVTFLKDPKKLVIYRTIPQQQLLMETDAPFLTPTPYRGTVCEPKHVAVTAEFVSRLRNQNLEQMIAATTTNAQRLFGMAK
jgi:TatD DNase family protein